MDAIKAAFESQFGTEWSNPVVSSNKEEKEDQEEFTDFNDIDNKEEVEDESRDEGEQDDQNQEQDGPIVVKYDETKLGTQQPIRSKSQRRKFMTSGAPKDDNVVNTPGNAKEDNEDLKNDLALQRLIEESHILGDRSKDQEFSGADISGAADPMDHVGKTRLKLMDSRLAKAGAKHSTQRMPQAMAVGIRDKRTERKQKAREEAREAGIVVAKDRHTRSKNRYRDKGLKINTVGKASEHGIHISQAEIDRISGNSRKSRVSKGRRK